VANARARLPDELDALLGPPIAYRASLARLCNSLPAALMLSQALYWITVTDDPLGWFYKTAEEWTRETFLTLSRQQSARRCLRQLGFWHEKLKGQPGKLHYRVDREKLLEALHQFAENPQTGIGKSANLDQAKHLNKNGAMQQSSLDDRRKPYKEAENTPENTVENTAAHIPPTPLQRGVEGSRSTKAGKDAELLSEFQLQLKDDMVNASFQSKNLDASDYDRYFRDTWCIEIRGNVILVDGTNRTLTAEGLRKYNSRLKQTFRKLSGKEVEFQMVRIGDGRRKRLQ
jgi:hypothetical protein